MCIQAIVEYRIEIIKTTAMVCVKCLSCTLKLLKFSLSLCTVDNFKNKIWLCYIHNLASQFLDMLKLKNVYSEIDNEQKC